MNVDFLIKTNPFSIPGVQTSQKESQTNLETTTGAKTTQTAAKVSGADYAQKMKNTNDAIGFIQTGQVFLKKLEKEGISDFEGAEKLAQKIFFMGKSIASKQSFDTNGGVVTIDIFSSEIGFKSKSFEEWKEGALRQLNSAKEQISNPLTAFGAAKRDELNAAAQKISTDKNLKLGSILDVINESLNRFEKKANELGNALF